MGYKMVAYIRKLMAQEKNMIFFHRKKEKSKMTELNENACEHISYTQAEMIPTSDDKMAQDLMRLVGSAIDEWANLYGMNNLPKKIIFQQALAILNAMETVFFQ